MITTRRGTGLGHLRIEGTVLLVTTSMFTKRGSVHNGSKEEECLLIALVVSAQVAVKNTKDQLGDSSVFTGTPQQGGSAVLPSAASPVTQLVHSFSSPLH